jgi:hypothetical protein
MPQGALAAQPITKHHTKYHRDSLMDSHEEREEARKLLLQETTRSCGERCLNTDTTGRHQQRWRDPETQSHGTAVVGKGVCTLHKDR